MKKYLIFLFISLLFLACKKEQSIHISAENAVTGKPYPDLGYTITRVKTGLFSSHHKEVASGELNENGEIYFTKRLDKNASYDIGLSQNPDNVCYINQASYTFGDGDKFDANFEFAQCTYLTLSVNNMNCQGSSDKIIFDMQPTYIENYNNITPTEKTGCYSNTFIESEVPFGSWKATWEVTRNNSTTYYDTTFFMDENEHFNLIINY